MRGPQLSGDCLEAVVGLGVALLLRADNVGSIIYSITVLVLQLQYTNNFNVFSGSHLSHSFNIN